MSEELSRHELTDCCEVLARIDPFLDHELSEEEADAVRRHLAECDECLEHADVEAATRALLRRCFGSQRAPESLRTRVLMRYTHVEIRTTD
ncbi:mycothiol system anti-sigma-R factor [Nigerium massiliense]|uniref:mycothiol system anti-sigma-R factor n=1 Tax=Nigerium massiliense TaxID=1522317 RepID=UPI00059080DE|nr:mycothiol system anti-sigma-R factor [Nigerium massiliense]